MLLVHYLFVLDEIQPNEGELSDQGKKNINLLGSTLYKACCDWVQSKGLLDIDKGDSKFGEPIQARGTDFEMNQIEVLDDVIGDTNGTVSDCNCLSSITYDPIKDVIVVQTDTSALVEKIEGVLRSLVKVAKQHKRSDYENVIQAKSQLLEAVIAKTTFLEDEELTNSLKARLIQSEDHTENEAQTDGAESEERNDQEGGNEGTEEGGAPDARNPEHS